MLERTGRDVRAGRDLYSDYCSFVGTLRAVCVGGFV